MSLLLNDEQQALRDSARRFLAAHSGSTAVRACMETEIGFDAEVWGRIAEELGWTAMAIPESYGGLGLGAVELSVLMEEMGRTLLCAPFFSTVCLATPALLLVGTEKQKQDVLPDIAAGGVRATLAWAEAEGRVAPEEIRCEARAEGSGFVLRGEKSFVVDGHSADLLIVAAREPRSAGIDGIRLFLVPATSTGVERTWLPTLDQTRRLARIRLDDVVVPRDALMGGAGSCWHALERVLDLASIALAAEQVGGADRCLDLAVDYAKVRVQFGRPIGSFQAIKHKCADMLLRVESARSAVRYAAQVAAQAGTAASDEEVASAAAMARAYASDSYAACAAEALQIHGGIGFTWEHDVHLFFKRARSSATLLGDASFHRERIARAIGL
ncbi:MAG: acyl-CoA dehydrogenase family protein [bacterium]